MRRRNGRQSWSVSQRSTLLRRAVAHITLTGTSSSLVTACASKPVGRIELSTDTSVDQVDIDLRNWTYGRLRKLGRAPTAMEVAGASGSSVDDVRAGWRRLHKAHALVLNQATAELRMLNPFSAVPSAHRVLADSRWWYGNCAWDAFGIFGALRADGHLETSCPDCGEAMAVEIRAGRPDDTSLLFHSLVPASQWWNDIVFT